MTTGLDDISSYISALASATALAYSYSFSPRYDSLACNGARYLYTGARKGAINASDAHRRNSLGGVQSAYSEYRYSSPMGHIHTLKAPERRRGSTTYHRKR
jgi:hypothetical protein